MDEPRQCLESYLADHLAGSRGALELIAHLGDHAADDAIRSVMTELHEDVEFDRAALERITRSIGGSMHPLREVSAWLAERISRLKLGAGSGPVDGLAQFEAVETVALGIIGKIKLWEVLLASGAMGLDQASLPGLRERALEQHGRVERERQRLAAVIFRIQPERSAVVAGVAL